MKMGNYLLNWSCTFKYKCVVQAWLDKGHRSRRRLIYSRMPCSMLDEVSWWFSWLRLVQLRQSYLISILICAQIHHKLKVFKHLYSQNYFWISYSKLHNQETFSKCTSSFPSDSKKCVSQREELLWPPTTIIERFSI